MLEKLSDREKQVFDLVCQNKTNVEIAEIICMSVPTVKKDMRNIYEKFGLESFDPSVNQSMRREVMLWGKEKKIVMQDGDEGSDSLVYTLEDIQHAAKILFPDHRIKVVRELVDFLQYKG